MKILIIGGGLSGLTLADMLESRGKDYLLLEARNRFGGRIMTEHFSAGYYDMGPAWFWPGQPRIAAMVGRLGMEKFEQFADGILAYEDEQGRVEHGRGNASMQGSWRLKGGLAALTQKLADPLPSSRKRLNAQVTALVKRADGITATLSNGETLTADHVVMSLPPRVAAKISYEPALPGTVIPIMQSISTWMAGHAKAVAVYDTPFWRDAGLSGDATSRKGPMVEIHDASPANGGPYALFGFIGVQPQARRDEPALRRQLLAQFERLFGQPATSPAQLYIKDWAFDPLTATPADQAPLYAHPVYGMPHAMSGLWESTLHFGSTEMAPQFGGYIEGALEAAENVLGILERKNTSTTYAN